ncbi:lipocalin family protein [Pontibacter sp. JH31]|uniref:Lipocalin family protein n=1 Tax=Pontibacter aquaedesilientis TaxID=2766980 RepID=A0ABR7XD38_9BACT|nr:lipocalin family protein [Pontibacter aquaedesilientis]MBD1395821.1 lipocalin family protein [Pontibacter aquaedesilientis]
MNILKISFLLLMAVFSLTLSACEKDKDTEPTKTDLIVAHEWKGDRVTVNGFDVSDRPEIKSMLLDIKSTTLTLRRDGTYTAVYTQNGVPQNTTGTWTFKENETILYFDLLGDLQIISLTGSNMSLFKTVTQGNTTYDAEVHFVK